MAKNITVSKNDVVRVDLSGSLGSEQGKIRYAVVIQNDVGNKHSPTTIIMPMTSKLKALYIPTHALIKKDNDNGLRVDSVILGEQLRVVSKERIIQRVGKITNKETLADIKRVYNANIGE